MRGNSTLTGADIDDDTLVRTGHEICGIARPAADDLDRAGHDAASSAARSGWSDDDVAAVVGSAIGAYCPRHIAVLDG